MLISERSRKDDVIGSIFSKRGRKRFSSKNCGDIKVTLKCLQKKKKKKVFCLFIYVAVGAYMYENEKLLLWMRRDIISKQEKK